MLLRHTAVYLLARGVPGIVNFAALAVFSRILSPTEYGRYALVISAAGLVDALAFQWLRLGLLRFLPSDAHPRQRLLATILTTFLRLAALLAVVAVIAAVVGPFDSATRRLILVGAALLALQSFYELNLEFTRTELAPARYGLFAIAKAIVALGAGAMLVAFDWGELGPLVGLLLAMALPLVMFGGIRPWLGVPLRSANPAVLRDLVMYGAPLATTAALAFVVNSSDRFLIAAMVDTASAGRYAVAYDLAQFTLGMLMMVVNLAAYPLAVRALERNGVEAARDQVRSNTYLLLAISLPAATGLAMLASNVSLVFVGAAFRDAAVHIVPWIALAAWLGGMKSFYVDLAFQLGRSTMGQVWVMAVAALTNVLLNLWWIPRWDVMGAVYATVVSYVVAVAMGTWLARRVFPLPPPSVGAAKIVIATVVMVLVVAPLRTLEGPAALVVQIVVGLVAYAAAMALFHRREVGAFLVARRERRRGIGPE